MKALTWVVATVVVLLAAFAGFSLYRDLAPVRFNAVHPGIISDSPAWRDKREAIANIEKRTPGGRLATTEDVVGAVDFLFTNRGVNGINLVIDGGWSIHE